MRLFPITLLCSVSGEPLVGGTNEDAANISRKHYDLSKKRPNSGILGF